MVHPTNGTAKRRRLSEASTSRPLGHIPTQGRVRAGAQRTANRQVCSGMVP